MIDCEGRHQCEPVGNATGLNEAWGCPDCHKVWTSFCLVDAPPATTKPLVARGFEIATMFGWRANAKNRPPSREG